MSANAKNEFKQLVICLMKSMLKTAINDLGMNPLDAQTYLQMGLCNVVNQQLCSNYNRLVFDSPLGIRSKDHLDRLHLMSEWEGSNGTRGLTTVYLPKDKYESLNSVEIKGAIEMMQKLIKDDQALFDEHSKLNLYK